jgi:uncharacterized membrane protein
MVEMMGKWGRMRLLVGREYNTLSAGNSINSMQGYRYIDSEQFNQNATRGRIPSHIFGAEVAMAAKKASHQPTVSLSMERLIFFSDAVFAIAITLLILDIRLPAGPETPGNEALLAQLIQIWPQYLAYIISFLVIGLFWLGHERKFRYIQRSDNRLRLLNLLVLMTVAFVPFPTAVISEYGNRTSTIFYASAILVSSLLFAGMWYDASHDGRLIEAGLPEAVIRKETLRSLMVPGIFLLSIPLAFINADLAKISWLLILPGYILIP